MEKLDELGPNPFAFEEDAEESGGAPEMRVERIAEEDPAKVRERLGMHAGRMTAAQWSDGRQKGKRFS